MIEFVLQIGGMIYVSFPYFNLIKLNVVVGPQVNVFFTYLCEIKFKIVKIPGTNLSDNEIKSKVINLFNLYFNADNWEFGETFYFTELSSFIHQNLGNSIGSIVILPKNTAGNFGDLFQVKAEPNELFISTATVNDVTIVEKITSQTLRADR